MAANTSTTPNAATQVFATPELLESILLKVDLASLVLCRRVNTPFYSTIKGSIHLQRELFLAPATLDQMTKLGLLSKDSLLLGDGTGKTFVLNPLVVDYEAPRNRNDESNFFLPMTGPGSNEDEDVSARIFLTTKIVSTPYRQLRNENTTKSAAALTTAPTGRTKPLRQMFLTQPPLLSLSAFGDRIFDKLHFRIANLWRRSDALPKWVGLSREQQDRLTLYSRRGLPEHRGKTSSTREWTFKELLSTEAVKVCDFVEVCGRLLAEQHRLTMIEPWADIMLTVWRKKDEGFESELEAAVEGFARDEDDHKLTRRLRAAAGKKYGV